MNRRKRDSIGKIPREKEEPAIRPKKTLQTLLYRTSKPSGWRTIPLRYRLSCLILAAAFALSALFTYGSRGTSRIPSWETLYRKAGLYGETSRLYHLPLCVTFLNVGQGDSTLISANGTFALIDSGNPGDGKLVLQEMKKQGCRELEYAIATHPHADHIGGFSEILSQIKVKTMIVPETNPKLLDDPSLYEEFVRSVRRSGARVILAKPGTRFALEKAVFTVLGPLGHSDNLNNLSVTVRLVYGQVSFLFPGDAETEEEYDILRSGLPLKSSILKCGHHGSKTSTSYAFLRAVHPETAVISCGRNNDYGHPSPETLEKLKRAGVRVFRTDRQGNIVVGTEGEKIWYS